MQSFEPVQPYLAVASIGLLVWTRGLTSEDSYPVTRAYLDGTALLRSGEARD